MKHTIVLLLFASFLLPVGEHNSDDKATELISDVQTKGNWIYVYDGTGKRISSMSSVNREVVGIASDFFVVLSGNWIYTYDIKCQRIASMSSADKTVRGASGNTFTVKSGNWIYTYDKKCKRIASRAG